MKLMKNYEKLAGKKKVSTEQKDAEELAPTITSWQHVAVLITKDFAQAMKMMITHVPGNWVADKWSRGGTQGGLQRRAEVRLAPPPNQGR